MFLLTNIKLKITQSINVWSLWSMDSVVVVSLSPPNEEIVQLYSDISDKHFTGKLTV